MRHRRLDQLGRFAFRLRLCSPSPQPQSSRDNFIVLRRLQWAACNAREEFIIGRYYKKQQSNDATEGREIGNHPDNASQSGRCDVSFLPPQCLSLSCFFFALWGEGRGTLKESNRLTCFAQRCERRESWVVSLSHFKRLLLLLCFLVWKNPVPFLVIVSCLFKPREIHFFFRCKKDKTDGQLIRGGCFDI